MWGHTAHPRERSWPPSARVAHLDHLCEHTHSLKVAGRGGCEPSRWAHGWWLSRPVGRPPSGWLEGWGGQADLKASGRPPRGGCWCCLTMSLICCVGCGKCSELRVEDRTSSRLGEAAAGARGHR